jgi:hypothetical protein
MRRFGFADSWEWVCLLLFRFDRKQVPLVAEGSAVPPFRWRKGDSPKGLARRGWGKTISHGMFT